MTRYSFRLKHSLHKGKLHTATCSSCPGKMRSDRLAIWASNIYIVWHDTGWTGRPARWGYACLVCPGYLIRSWRWMLFYSIANHMGYVRNIRHAWRNGLRLCYVSRMSVLEGTKKSGKDFSILVTSICCVPEHTKGHIYGRMAAYTTKQVSM